MLRKSEWFSAALYVRCLLRYSLFISLVIHQPQSGKWLGRGEKGPLGGNPPWMTSLMMIIFMLSVWFSTWRSFADGNGTKKAISGKWRHKNMARQWKTANGKIETGNFERQKVEKCFPSYNFPWSLENVNKRPFWISLHLLENIKYGSDYISIMIPVPTWFVSSFD